ncbi:hypothetical protein L2E82_14955 [Cichorium intybus]|uniref:Uncharacterized protein n=1 Tax=Cichorium intybus TaxID=13427 RepID=A0ACB9F224_CICIN|nr:hypothetical protein L2E82_14955 [Cichorium intybus]
MVHSNFNLSIKIMADEKVEAVNIDRAAGATYSMTIATFLLGALAWVEGDVRRYADTSGHLFVWYFRFAAAAGCCAIIMLLINATLYLIRRSPGVTKWLLFLTDLLIWPSLLLVLIAFSIISFHVSKSKVIIVIWAVVGVVILILTVIMILDRTDFEIGEAFATDFNEVKGLIAEAFATAFSGVKRVSRSIYKTLLVIRSKF